MNKKFTKLIAALTLLVFMTPSLAGWGQTRETLSLTFPLTSNPGGWPTTNPTTLTNYTYSLSGVNYTFALKNVKCNSGYLMMTSTAVLGLPAIDGYKLTTVVASNSSGCSTSTKVGISSSATQASYISGGAIQTWSTTSSSYTYNLTSTEANTMYYMYVTNKNAQVVELALTYESTGGTPAPSMSVSTNSIDFGSSAINPANPYTETFDVTFANLTENLTVSVGSGLTGVSVSPTSITANATSPQTITVSYNPTDEGSLNGNITVSSSEVTAANVAVTGLAYDPANVLYYEKVTEASTNWSGEYIFTGINSSNYYALTGVNNSLGTVAQVSVTENGIQSISTTDGYKVTVAQTTNGYSLYLAGAGYLYYTGSSNALYAAQTFTANTCEWTFSFANGVATITNVGSNSRILQFNYNSGNPRFACYGNSNQTKITLFKYNDPNKVKAPTFSPEGGIYTAAQNVTISSETSGASIYYTTDGSMPTTESTLFNGAFMVSTTTTVKAIAVKSGMTDSDVASTTYTFVTPFTTMQQVYEDAVANTSEHEVYITFNNWVITGTNGSSASQFYLTDPDNAYGCVIYGSGSGFTRGNTLNGTVRCKLLYFSSGSAYSFAEIKELTTQTAGLTVGTGGSVTPITTTIDALTSEKTGTVVKLENLTYNGTVLTDNNNNIINNSNYIYSATLSTDKTYNITGVFTYAYAQNNTPKRICPRNADDVVEVENTDPVINANNGNIAYDATSGAIAYTIENPVAGITLGVTCDAAWVSNIVVGDESVTFTTTANEGNADRTATFTFTYTGAQNKTVIVTQAHYVPDYATLPFEYDGNGTGTLPNGFTCYDLGTYSSSPKMQFNSTGDWAILKINARPGTLTFDIKGNSFSGGTFKVQTSEDGQTYSDLKTYDYLTTTVQNESFNNLGADVRYIRWIYTEKSSGNVALGKINLAAYVAPQPYDLTVSTLTNAEILVFDATSPNENDWVDLLDGSGTVSVAEGTPIALSVSAEQGYVLTELMVNGVNHVADIDGSGVYTFDMPTQDVTITVTAVQTYTIMFSVNGQELASAEMEVAQGSTLGTLPTPTENIPAGFTFVGWMESPAHPYYNATTAPTMVNAQTVPQDDMILDAVFCIAGTTTTTWTLSDAAPVHGEQVILAALDDSKYYAMNGPTGIEFTVSNNSITGNVPEAIFTANISLEGSYLIQGNNYLHFNSSALKLASGTTNGDITYTAKDGGFTLYANSRYMTYNSTSHGFGVSQMEDDAETMLVFKASTVTSDATDYTTLVTNHADQSTIAENAAETLYGIHYINGYVLAGAGVTNNGKLVIKANAQLDMDESSLTNATAANLIIEDGGQLIHNNAGVQATVQKNIAAHGATPADGGWYFISSPIMSSSSYDYGITPSAAGLITDNYGSSIPEGATATYDLFKFDQSVDLEWRNYRNANFNLERSEGYLYANMNDVTLSFEGEIRSSDGNATTGLDNISGASLAGWNLKGNPFTCKAYSSLPYYVIDSAQLNTTAVVASTPIDVCTGIMVHGSNSMTFSRTQQVNAPNGNLQMNLAQQVVSRDGTSTGSTTIDNAIVSFNESDMLEKFVFNADLSKLYIPQDGKDYAIVASEGQGTLPVNFKATENGNYTLTVNPEGVDLNYLHLIDNMTGNDVDLLQTPSYTFEASTRDYESRFRLVFASASTDSATDETFAYYDGSEWKVSNEGEATLQVVDVMGRIISTETINGNFNLNLNQKAGVYMLRLVNGENVKVQKVVVR